MCGRYASARKRQDLLEEFRIDRDRVTDDLEPDYNVAPTKPVYAVLTRVRRGPEPRAGPPEQPGADVARELHALLAPAAASGLASYPVGTDVNYVRNNGPALIEPLAGNPAPLA